MKKFTAKFVFVVHHRKTHGKHFFDAMRLGKSTRQNTFLSCAKKKSARQTSGRTAIFP
jgi:hypothetical protein